MFNTYESDSLSSKFCYLQSSKPSKSQLISLKMLPFHNVLTIYALLNLPFTYFYNEFKLFTSISKHLKK